MIGENITKFRETKGWTQEKFASKFNSYLAINGIKDTKYNNRTISQWENEERSPKDFNIIYLLSKFMGTSLDDLFDKEISRFNLIDDETIGNCTDDIKETIYHAILGIYDYDKEKGCYLTKFVSQYKPLVIDPETGSLTLDKYIPLVFSNVKTLVDAINHLNYFGADTVENYKQYICDNFYDGDDDWFDSIWEDDWWPHTDEGLTGIFKCDFEDAEIDGRNLNVHINYVSDPSRTYVIEFSAELYLSEAQYSKLLKRIYNTGINYLIDSFTTENALSKSKNPSSSIQEYPLTLDEIAGLRKIFLEYEYNI